MNPTNPTQPEFGPWGPNSTQLNPYLDPWGPTRPKIGLKSGSFGFIKYIIGLNPNLNPIWGQPNPIVPVLDPEGQPDRTQPKCWVQKWVQHKNTGRVWPQ